MKRLVPAALTLTAIATIAAGTYATRAYAESNQDFVLWNDTGFFIGEVHVTLANDDEWGEDVLGEDILEPGDHTEITFSGYKPKDCIFDIQIRKGNDGAKYLVEDVNLCKLNDLSFYTKKGKVFVKKH